jgi:glycosyltransferase involved in cell wall biosynthesis
MRILWVKVGGLWPLNTGGRLRTFHIVRELGRRHDVTVLTTHGPADDPNGLARELSMCRVSSIPWAAPKLGSARFVAALARSWLSSRPVELDKWRVPEVRREAERLVAGGQVDLCVADFLVSAPNVPSGTPTPVVLFEHNVEHMIWKRLRDVEGQPLHRALLGLEWQKMRRFESRACAQAALTLAVSEEDRRLLEADAPAARIASIPTGVDTAFFQPKTSEEIPGYLVFTGSMDWHPNEDGLLDFLERTWPRLRERVPHVTLSVVGRNPRPRLRQAAERAGGVTVTGTVADIRPYVHPAAVYIAPLRVGGGTRLKLFEALAMGKAVVASRIAAEGLPLVPDRHFIEANEPSELVPAITGLLRDRNRRAALGAAGRRLVEESFSWPIVADEFEDRLAEVVSGGCAVPRRTAARLA